nr:MAG TPA: Protein of unknown function (DUF3149) [Caudoviricetes sp.]
MVLLTLTVFVGLLSFSGIVSLIGFLFTVLRMIFGL